MFEPFIIKKWKCKDSSKIVTSRYMNTDTKEIFEARFTLDEITDIKEKVGRWYFIKFKSMEGEYALPCDLIENNFILRK